MYVVGWHLLESAAIVGDFILQSLNLCKLSFVTRICGWLHVRIWGLSIISIVLSDHKHVLSPQPLR